jgi:hypothetical protein
MHEVTEASVWEALQSGRAYVAFDWMADPTGFAFRAERGNETWPIGSQISYAEGTRLRAEAPLAGRFKLMRDGEVILDKEDTAIDFPLEQPGVYRVEVWLSLAGEGRPWILTNPIYVRSHD